MDEESLILVAKEDGIAVVTIHRPKVLNALNKEVFCRLKKGFTDLAADDEVRAIVLTGAGEKAFVGGSDIEMMANLSPLESRTLCREFHETLSYIETIEKPVIAAVNGYALGGGCELALACDIRIASERAQFAFPEVSLGIIPGSGGTQRLPKLIGKSRAKLMIFGGSYFDAETALSYGLADQVTSHVELMPTCVRLAKQFAKQPALSLALAKRAVDMAGETNLLSGLAYETEAFTVSFASEEKKRRMAAHSWRGGNEFSGAPINNEPTF